MPDGDTPLPFPGSLCHRCAAPPRYVHTGRSTFVLCPLIPGKYPPQPVRTCPLFRERTDEPPRVAGRARGSLTTGRLGEPPRARRRPRVSAAFLGVALLALASLLWGVRLDLPYAPEVDEPFFVVRAANMVASGVPNPGWFGHPGSTVMYPVAFVIYLWNVLVHGGRWLPPDPGIVERIAAHPPDVYVLGRAVTIGYALASLALLSTIGRSTVGRRAALAAAALTVLSPLFVTHVRIARSDGASVVFTMLALTACLALARAPTIGRHALAGLAVGLAVASKYYLVALGPVLLVAALVAPEPRRWSRVALALAAVPVGFLVITPYFVLDFPAVLKDVRVEIDTVHLGSDGLSPLGNLWWYLRVALPEAMTWPFLLLAGVGIVSVAVRRQPLELLLLLFPAVLLLELSRSPLHWARWILPALPVLFLLAAHGLERIATAGAAWAGLGARARGFALTAVFVVVALPLARARLVEGWLHQEPSTRVVGRQWIVDHVPDGNLLAVEWYTTPLTSAAFLAGYAHDRPERASFPEVGKTFRLLERYALAEGVGLDWYQREGFDYLVASSAMYGRFLAEPARYPHEVAFYQALFTQAELMAEIVPTPTRGGPVIRIYRLRR